MLLFYPAYPYLLISFSDEVRFRMQWGIKVNMHATWKLDELWSSHDNISLES